MSYSDSAYGESITERRTAQELARHGWELPLAPDDLADLDACAPQDENGERDAGEVLEWLGY